MVFSKSETTTNSAYQIEKRYEMNKQEKEKLISFIEKEKENITLKHGKYSQTHFGFIWGTKLIEFIEQLDEPQKVKVPEFVVEWFKENKHNLNFAIYELCEAGKVPVDLYEGLTDFERWFYLNHDIDTLIRMQDGYEVEEEPKYQVKLKFGRQYLSKNADGNMLDFYSCMVFPPSFSKKELESIEDGAFYKADGDKEWINPIIELVPVEKV